MKIQHSENHRELRAKEYPRIGDQLDAILKMTVALKAQGINLPEETTDWIDRCLAVKSKYKNPAS